MRRGVGDYAQSSFAPQGRALAPIARPDRQQPDAYTQLTQKRAAVGRFFVDLRKALRLTPTQAALTLSARIEVIEALETGHFELLPPWPETTRIVLAYTARAGVDGRPVLGAMAALMPQAPRGQAALPAPRSAQPGHSTQPAYSDQRGQSAPTQPSRRPRSEHLRRAGTAIAAGAKHVRARPDRAFYAVSLPLGVVLLALNTSVLSHAAKPLGEASRWVMSSVHEVFPIVRDGLRWIEVDDPRSRRADKLRTPSQ